MVSIWWQLWLLIPLILEAKYDDDPLWLLQLSSSTGIKEPVIEHAQVIDYLNFKPKDIELDAGGKYHYFH